MHKSDRFPAPVLSALSSVANPNRETRHGFLLDSGVTIWRVVGGFALAAVIVVPHGVPAGAYWAAKQVANSFATRFRAHIGMIEATTLRDCGSLRLPAEQM
jgi:ABC-type nitrate/sulfonate/bicarbonate transport system permease component